MSFRFKRPFHSWNGCHLSPEKVTKVGPNKVTWRTWKICFFIGYGIQPLCSSITFLIQSPALSFKKLSWTGGLEFWLLYFKSLSNHKKTWKLIPQLPTTRMTSLFSLKLEYIPNLTFHFAGLITLPKTNESHLKIGRAPKGNNHLPTVHFQVLLVC